jgi:[ribosomal protein S5]-alanine N-acetyltransferase
MSEAFKKMEITGDTVRLRVFQKTDISDTYTSWLNDAEVVKYSKQRFFDYTIESCHNYMKSFSDTDNMYLAIEDKVTKELHGSITAYIQANYRTSDNRMIRIMQKKTQ